MTRFTLRDVFWLTLVVALALGWRLDQLVRNQTENELRTKNVDLMQQELRLNTEIDRQRSELRKHRGG